MSAPADPQFTPPALSMNIALTGATGFVGRYCVRKLAQRGCALTLLQRGADNIADVTADSVLGQAYGETEACRIVAVGDLSEVAGSPATLGAALAGADALVHLAGRAHRVVGTGAEALALYRAHNTVPTLALARAAASAGVRHMVFASTSYVHGHVTEPGRPFDSNSPLNPSGAYAVSKAEAEQALRELAPQLGLAVSIIRPAVVHGPNPTANIRALLTAVRRGAPLPFGAIRNQRSFLGQENLSSFIAHVLAHPPEPGVVDAWTLADEQTPSTPEFVRMLGAAVGRKPLLAPIPPGLLRRGLVLAGRAGMAESLIDTFKIDMNPVLVASGWRPPFTLAEGLAHMAAATD